MVPIAERKTYSILLADDMTLVMEGLAALCRAPPAFRVVGQCSEGVSALKVIETDRPDLAVLDLNLPELHTLGLVRRVRDANLPTRIVVLSTKRDRKTVVEALRSERFSAVVRSVERACRGFRPSVGRRDPHLTRRRIEQASDFEWKRG